MTLTAFPFDAQSVSETNYSRLFRELQSSGVAEDGANVNGAFKATVTGTNMNITLAAGFAIVRGHALYSDANYVVAAAASGAATRIDRVVLRLDPSTNSITPTVLTGVAGSGSPAALTQTDTGIYDEPLWKVTVSTGATGLVAANLEDERRVLDRGVGVWKNDGLRPTSPRTGRMGFNIGQGRFEFWTGAAWAAISNAVAWGDITGKPSTFAPSAHTHQWSDISDRPTSFTPSAHLHTFSSLQSIPASFTPSAHTHSYSGLSGIPSSFTPSSHQHPGSAISGTVALADGSQGPRTRSVSGAGTYYAVWVNGNDDFCRNTSSQRYKQNIRNHAIDPARVLALQPRLYDRIDGPAGEYGLIAEEVAATVPEVVTMFEGEIDGVRYDLLSVALLDVVKAQHAQIANLLSRVDALEEAL